MDKEKIRKLFDHILEEYEDNKWVVINDYGGTMDERDFEIRELKFEIHDLREKLNTYLEE